MTIVTHGPCWALHTEQETCCAVYHTGHCVLILSLSQLHAGIGMAAEAVSPSGVDDGLKPYVSAQRGSNKHHHQSPSGSAPARTAPQRKQSAPSRPRSSAAESKRNTHPTLDRPHARVHDSPSLKCTVGVIKRDYTTLIDSTTVRRHLRNLIGTTRQVMRLEHSIV